MSLTPLRAWLALLSVSFVYAGSAAAQGYPAKPVRIVIPFAVGSSPQELAAFIRKELSTWPKVVTTAGIRID